ncbi:hypothetical protein [Weissella minor]|uniref:hypothetical protein n=1 Tax=Weissella minor TaxID=1620 RepID=UPI003AF2B246
MNEKEYKLFEKERLTGMPIRDIATKYNHGHSFYQRNGYVERFKQEYPNFIETRGRGYQKGMSKPETQPNINENEYKAFEAQKLAGKSMDDILYNSPHGKQYYYLNGYVARFNREHPEYKLNKYSRTHALTENQIYNEYIEYHRHGMTIDRIAKQLNISIARIKQVITNKENKSLWQYADQTLANQVQQAKHSDKFKIIDEFRRALIADYGTTLMDVPNNEPRLLSLQLANRMLDK